MTYIDGPQVPAIGSSSRSGMELINHHQVLDCGHTPGELFTFQGPGVFTDHGRFPLSVDTLIIGS
ncbi:hypothetical protein OIU91_04140 [Streptomyces sp. NBC_01456]|uniref:hypothetical protein n=1 Tax=unclassified Streptomyces TaxID=2593676 RepID=UPI002E2F2889|nr:MULTISPECIES: hypothetical protein [unclassified Streptomyces]